MNYLKDNSLFRPARCDSPYVMLALHASGDTMFDLLPFARSLNLPNLNTLFLNGPFPRGDGYEWKNKDYRESFEIIEEGIDWILGEGYRREDILFFGYAEGAQPALEFNLQSAYAFRACVAISPLFQVVEDVSSFVSGKPNPERWLITQGNVENLEILEDSRRQVEFMRSWGFTVDYIEYYKSRQIEPVGEVPLISDWLTRILLQDED